MEEILRITDERLRLAPIDFQKRIDPELKVLNKLLKKREVISHGIKFDFSKY